MKIFKLANAFVHADWISSTETIGEYSPEITDGAAEGAGEILYLVMETTTKMIQLIAPEELREEFNADIWNLRTQIKGHRRDSEENLSEYHSQNRLLSCPMDVWPSQP